MEIAEKLKQKTCAWLKSKMGVLGHMKQQLGDT